MAKNFPKLMTDTKLQIQEAQRTSGRINTIQNPTIHISISYSNHRKRDTKRKPHKDTMKLQTSISDEDRCRSSQQILANQIEQDIKGITYHIKWDLFQRSKDNSTPTMWRKGNPCDYWWEYKLVCPLRKIV